MRDSNYKCIGFQHATSYLFENSKFQRSRQRKLKIESMASTKVACFLMFVLFVGASKAENADISEGNGFDVVRIRKITSANKLFSAMHIRVASTRNKHKDFALDYIDLENKFAKRVVSGIVRKVVWATKKLRSEKFANIKCFLTTTRNSRLCRKWLNHIFFVFAEFNVRADMSDSSLMSILPKLESERIETKRPSSSSQVWN